MNRTTYGKITMKSAVASGGRDFRVLTRAFLLGAALVAATLPFATIAHAEEPIDTVVLSNGGRVRGSVLESEPKTGTTIRMLDGTTRKLKPAEVTRVEYGEDSAPAPPPPASLAPIAASGAIASNGASPIPAAEGDPAHAPSNKMQIKMQMRSTPAFVTGTVLVSLGAVLGIAGAILFAANSQTKDASYQDCNTGLNGGLGPCATEHEAYTNSTGKTTGEVLLVVGSLGMVTGLVIALVGGARVPAKPTVKTQALSLEPTVGARSVGLTMRF